ncbi:response regulator [Chromobacterium haemolyticum]|nr:response regulator [Chromobacterium haemolyticum]
MPQILVVDDEAISRQFLTAVLRQMGMSKISEAVDGLDALMQLDAGDRAFDLIFCDLDMPRMDGVEFVRHLGERAYQGKLLITSGFDERVLDSVADLARMYALRASVRRLAQTGESGAIAGDAGRAHCRGRGALSAHGADQQRRVAPGHRARRGGAVFPAAGGRGLWSGVERGGAGALAASSTGLAGPAAIHRTG